MMNKTDNRGEKTVLIVEDQALMRQTLHAFLQEAFPDWNLLDVADGASALEACNAYLYRRMATGGSCITAARYEASWYDGEAAAARAPAPVAPSESGVISLARSAFAPEVLHQAGGEQAKGAGDADSIEHDERETPRRKARACADEGRLAEAIDWCEQAIAADKLKPAHYYLLAAICQEQGQSERAERSLGRALYLAPDFALAHFALGNLFCTT